MLRAFSIIASFYRTDLFFQEVGNPGEKGNHDGKKVDYNVYYKTAEFTTFPIDNAKR